jgi:hypothetical protein
MEFHVWVSLLAIMLSGVAIVILITQRRSMGCFTERIERAQEGTRRSNELKRQSDERVIDRVNDLGLKADLLAELMKATHERSA